MTSSGTPASEAPQKPSKGPPPLPTMAATAPPHGGTAVEEIFVEGIDGRAESLPPAEPHAPAVDEQASSDTDAMTMSRDNEWFEAHEEEEAAEEDVEDPARTRRRKVARIGVAWGGIALLALGAATAFIRPRATEPSAASSSSPPPVETVAHAPVATPIVSASSAAPARLAAAVPASRPPARAMTASAPAAAATPRAVVRKGTSPSPAKRASSSPKGAGERAKPAPKRPAPRAASTRKRP
jgi:hypothetical protein